jgi:thymidylate synthase
METLPDMPELKFASLGETWLRLVEATLQRGDLVDREYRELLGVQVGFPAVVGEDEVVRRWGDPGMLANMREVFFGKGTNPLGHSYAKLMRGPDGRADLSDIISLLRLEPSSKRALVTLCGAGGGKVPCINAIQFLVRPGGVQVIYFARGQDAFKKFYADALCIAQMARRVADELGRPAGAVTGFLGSSHVYVADQPAIEEFLSRGNQWLLHGAAKGVD